MPALVKELFMAVATSMVCAVFLVFYAKCRTYVLLFPHIHLQIQYQSIVIFKFMGWMPYQYIKGATHVVLYLLSFWYDITYCYIFHFSTDFLILNNLRNNIKVKYVLPLFLQYTSLGTQLKFSYLSHIPANVLKGLRKEH